MAKLMAVFKCSVCGNIVEVYHEGGGKLSCCGKEMNLLAENTVDASKEKHVPVIEKVEGGIRVKVGSVAHPMEEKHFIEWVEIVAGGKVYREHLKPGAKPEAVFKIDAAGIVAKEYCNLHGLWKA